MAMQAGLTISEVVIEANELAALRAVANAARAMRGFAYYDKHRGRVARCILIAYWDALADALDALDDEADKENQNERQAE